MTEAEHLPAAPPKTPRKAWQPLGFGVAVFKGRWHRLAGDADRIDPRPIPRDSAIAVVLEWGDDGAPRYIFYRIPGDDEYASSLRMQQAREDAQAAVNTEGEIVEEQRAAERARLAAEDAIAAAGQRADSLKMRLVKLAGGGN